MTQYIVTVGYIPKGCSSEVISCGDPDKSLTKENSVFIDGANLWCQETQESFDADDEDWFNPGSTLWVDFAGKFADVLSDGAATLDPTEVGRCWSFFQDEGELGARATVVARDSAAGEFSNKGYGDGEHWYVRYQMEDDGEYFDETVVLIKS